MPVRPDLRRYYYGPIWDAIRADTLERAHNCCQSCGAANGSHGLRNLATGDFRALAGNDLEAAHAASQRVTVIRLGACHTRPFDGNTNADNPLVALCDFCHLRHDLQQHRDSRAARKDRSRPLIVLALDQNITMVGEPEWKRSQTG